MSILLLVAGAFALYALGYRFYAPHLARAFGEDDRRPTPAVAKEDGVDYVPTRPHVLFAHHFSAIAAAGPIIGPTLALSYGVVPAWAWIVIGGVFFGAAHDFATLFVAVREGGHSIAVIARRTLGTPAFAMFVLFLIFNLVIVNATFLNLTVVSLTSLLDLATLGLGPDQTIFRTAADGKAVVGGIASTSAIALTAVAPLLGWLVCRRGLRKRYAYPLATALCVGSVLVGFALPVTLAGDTWKLLIALYVLIAAAVPVWLVLQPREFVSVQFLYLGIGLILAAVLASGFRGFSTQAPAFGPAIEAGPVFGWLWPSLFITIACGAISGFHGLVGSGTTCKQIEKESHAKHIGYLGMLGESALAVCVTLAVAGGMTYERYAALKATNPPLAFSVGVGGNCEQGLGIAPWIGVLFGLLMVEGIILDTLDVSIRLNRYLFEEIWSLAFGSKERVPRLLRSCWFNSGIAVAAMLLLAYRNTSDILWPIFGSGNQLLAALSLLAVSVWLFRERRRVAYTLVPAVLILVTTVGSLVYLLVTRYAPARNYPLALTAVLFLGLALGVVAYVVRAFRRGPSPLNRVFAGPSQVDASREPIP